MWRKWAGLKFRVKLGTEEKRGLLAGQFSYFHKYPVRRNPRKNQAGFFELRDIFGINFISVTMALGNDFFAIRFTRNRPRLEMSGVSTQTHGRAVFAFRHMLFLLRHNVY